MEIAELINEYGEKYSPYMGKLVNHLPMTQWALYQLTGDIELVEEYTSHRLTRMDIDEVKADYPQVDSLEECLGKRELYESCLDFIRAEVEDQDIHKYIAYILNRYSLGMSSGLFHPMIRLAYAVEGMRYDPNLIDEVYRALAYYITGYREMKVFKNRKKDFTYDDLKPLFESELVAEILDSEDSLGKRMKALYESEDYLERGYLLELDDQNKLERMIFCTIPLYTRSKNIVALHCVNVLHALVVLEGYFEDYSYILDLATTAIVTHIIAASVEHKEIKNDTVAVSWDYIISKIESTTDSHSIKLTYATSSLAKIFPREELKKPAIVRLTK